MYYAFIDGQYVGSARHVKYLKKCVEEDMTLFRGFWAVIYSGERSYCAKFYNEPWRPFLSSKKDRPAITFNR